MIDPGRNSPIDADREADPVEPADDDAAQQMRRAGAGAFFGRRKGHRLRAHQNDLIAGTGAALAIPVSAPISHPQSLFSHPVRALRLEIGFGGGKHLAARALKAPDIGFIGCEGYLNGVAKLTAAITGHGLANVRLHHGDAQDLMALLPDGCIERVDLLYPDPWPKRRQQKRRFVSSARLAALARILKPGGIFAFATDIDDYAAWTLARVLSSPDFDWAAQASHDWLTPWEGWPGTRYEAKALREGRRPVYLTFLRR